ncbi:MAG: hypothetical protein H6R17_2445 [Proteobacteria bacterium]|nr:hypothetical protein [Pseudomonadota bacterium]
MADRKFTTRARAPIAAASIEHGANHDRGVH